LYIFSENSFSPNWRNFDYIVSEVVTEIVQPSTLNTKQQPEYQPRTNFHSTLGFFSRWSFYGHSGHKIHSKNQSMDTATQTVSTKILHVDTNPKHIH